MGEQQQQIEAAAAPPEIEVVPVKKKAQPKIDKSWLFISTVDDKVLIKILLGFSLYIALASIVLFFIPPLLDEVSFSIPRTKVLSTMESQYQVDEIKPINRYFILNFTIERDAVTGYIPFVDISNNLTIIDKTTRPLATSRIEENHFRLWFNMFEMTAKPTTLDQHPISEQIGLRGQIRLSTAFDNLKNYKIILHMYRAKTQRLIFGYDLLVFFAILYSLIIFCYYSIGHNPKAQQIGAPFAAFIGLIAFAPLAFSPEVKPVIYTLFINMVRLIIFFYQFTFISIRNISTYLTLFFIFMAFYAGYESLFSYEQHLPELVLHLQNSHYMIIVQVFHWAYCFIFVVASFVVLIKAKSAFVKALLFVGLGFISILVTLLTQVLLKFSNPIYPDLVYETVHVCAVILLLMIVHHPYQYKAKKDQAPTQLLPTDIQFQQP